MEDGGRQHWDEEIDRRHAVAKVIADLGIRQQGEHYFCPGCQPGSHSRAEMVVKRGRFKCYQCSAEGDLVGLVKLARKCSLEEAIVWLKVEAGDVSS